MLLNSTLKLELLDFLAEKFLRQEMSISYVSIAGVPALRVTSANDEMFFPAICASEEMIMELPTNVKILIPVLKQEEEDRYRKLLNQADREDVEIYRLSLYERHSFLSMQFMKRQLAV